MSSFYVRAIGHAGAMRWSAQPCVCICASDPATNRTAVHLHMCGHSKANRTAVHLHMYERCRDEAHNRTSAYVQATPRRSTQLRICACASAQRRSAQPCTCACNHRRSAQPHICICASGAATNRIAVRLYLCKRLPQRSTQPCICTQMGDKCSASICPCGINRDFARKRRRHG